MPGVRYDSCDAVLIAAPERRAIELASAFARARFVPVLAFDTTQLLASVGSVPCGAVVVDDALDPGVATLDDLVAADVVVLLLGDPVVTAARRVHGVLARDVPAVQVVMRTQAMLELTDVGPARQVLTWGPLRLDAARKQATLYGQPLELSPPQRRILRALVKAQGGLVTKAELQRAAYPYDAVPGDDERLLQQVRRIRQKLRAHGVSPDFLRTERGAGFRLTDLPGGTWDGVERRRRERRAAPVVSAVGS